MRPADAVARYLRQLTIERGLSKHTLAAYRRDLDGYLAVLGSRGRDAVAAIDASDVQAFHASLADRGLAASSVARQLSAVRGLHRFLVDERLVEQDVARDHRPPRQGMPLPKAVTIAQMQRILDHVGGDDAAGLRDRALLELLYATGARISEVCDLDVDDAHEELLRLTGKGGKQRLVPVGSYARDAVDAYLVRARPMLAVRGRGGPALLLGTRGGRLSRQAAWSIIQRVAASAEVEHVSPHTFRHSFATHLLEGGADVRVVQELLGHASVATTQIYTRVTADTLRDMYTTAHPRARR